LELHCGLAYRSRAEATLLIYPFENNLLNMIYVVRLCYAIGTYTLL